MNVNRKTSFQILLDGEHEKVGGHAAFRSSLHL